MTQGYIIYLPKYSDSISMANRAMETGTMRGWNLQLYEGVDGTLVKLEDYNLRSSLVNKKCQRLLERPGTQGCFLSQYLLWEKCFLTQTPICIFEHDVVFKKPMGEVKECDVYKFEGFKKAKPIAPGNWYEGARAYRLTPPGAKKLLDWTFEHGAMPADWMLCDGIVDMIFDKGDKVTFKSNVSFTKDL
jgi:GR25 family glycosyltransferase involved in LPS biosynthesis|tara:strand:+ start:2328 stop:2894 length:567 start_codon:yes stop_codon:yes gene_type:complete